MGDLPRRYLAPPDPDSEYGWTADWQPKGSFRYGRNDDEVFDRRFVQAFPSRAMQLVDTVTGADLTAPVDSCPGGTSHDSSRTSDPHIDGLRKMRRRRTQPLDYKPFLLSVPAGAGDLIAWLTDGVKELTAQFQNVDFDEPMWTLVGVSRLAFWPRRMLHEISIHTADAEMALGSDVSPISGWIARDGIDEFLTLLPHSPRLRGQVVTNTTSAPDSSAEVSPRQIVLAEAQHRIIWRIDWSPPTYTWSKQRVSELDRDAWSIDPADWAPETAEADVRIAGSAADLYLYLYGRPTRTGRPLVTGDEQLLARWREATNL